MAFSESYGWIEQAIKDAVEKAVAEEIEAASVRIADEARAKVRERLGAITLGVLEYFNAESNHHGLVITVKNPKTGGE